MRSPRNKPTPVNLLKPVNDIPSGSDCFGTYEYNPRSGDCSLCADIELCGLKYQETVKEKLAPVDAKGPFLDQVDTYSVNWGKIKQKIVDYQEDDPLTVDEVVEAVMVSAKIKDSGVALNYVKAQFIVQNITEEDGKVYIR